MRDGGKKRKLKWSVGNRNNTPYLCEMRLFYSDTILCSKLNYPPNHLVFRSGWSAIGLSYFQPFLSWFQFFLSFDSIHVCVSDPYTLTHSGDITYHVIHNIYTKMCVNRNFLMKRKTLHSKFEFYISSIHCGCCFDLYTPIPVHEYGFYFVCL